MILDESTNTLGKVTEQNILKTIRTLSNKLTVLIISHPLSALKHADMIYFLKDGTIQSEGTYQELISKNQDFKLLNELS